MSETVLSAGSLIGGRYRLEHHLGEGGMGTVWSALHTVTHRAVAMKFLKDSVRERTDLRQRFLREASAASALKHPNAVEILDVFDFEESSPVMVMELLQGETLGSKLARDQRLSVEETAALMSPVVSAVGTAHALGIVHRDLKPDNLFLEERTDGARVKVLDFGIAKLSAEYYHARGLSALHTDAGSMLGTPYYMAPEQASGERAIDHRADVWSLGVILYECLSGTRPIEGETMPQVISRLMSAGIMPLERLAPELPHEVTGIVMQMLSRDPGRRPDGLLEVSRVLGRYARMAAPEFGEPSRARRSLPPPTSRRPSPRIVSGKDADPQGPTMLSAPPVNHSISTEGSPARQRVISVPIVVGVVAVACLIAVLFSRVGPDKDKAAGVAASASAVVPALTASASPVPCASVEQVPPPASAAPPKARPAAVVGAFKAKASAKPDVSPKPTPNDETLFSGRK